MNFKLIGHSIVTSKKNGKKYILIDLRYKNIIIDTIIAEYNEMLEQFCRNYENQFIDDYIRFSYRRNIKGFVPYIEYM